MLCYVLFGICALAGLFFGFLLTVLVARAWEPLLRFDYVVRASRKAPEFTWSSIVATCIAAVVIGLVFQNAMVSLVYTPLAGAFFPMVFYACYRVKYELCHRPRR